MQKIQVKNGQKTFQYELRNDNGKLYIKRNGTEHAVDLVRLDNNRYSMILDGRSHEIGIKHATDGYVVYSGYHADRFIVEDYEVARMKRKAGIEDSKKDNKLSAPMPGMIVSISCQPGDEVTKNQPLLVMEAMKMENDIKAPAAGKIKSVSINVGDNVDKNQVLVEFE